MVPYIDDSKQVHQLSPLVEDAKSSERVLIDCLFELLLRNGSKPGDRRWDCLVEMMRTPMLSYRIRCAEPVPVVLNHINQTKYYASIFILQLIIEWQN